MARRDSPWGLVLDGRRELMGRWSSCPLPPCLPPLLATPDPGRRNSGSHSTDEETEVQTGFTPTPIPSGVHWGLC